MSGQDFINFLDEIGFPKSNELDADSFDWMFDNQETKDFMQWLTHDLSSENVIMPEEISRFEQLKSSGGLVLDNERLEEALMIERSKNSMFIDDHLYADDPSKRIEAVKKQIEETESQIRSVKKRKNLLTKQRNVLEEHRSSIIEKQAKLEKALKIAGSEYEREISNVKAADQSYDEAVNSLLPALDNLMTHYKNFGSEHNYTSSSVMTPNLNLFVSQVSLDRFQKQDDEFLRELSNYAKHLFSTSSNVNMTEDTMKSFGEGCFTHIKSSFLKNPVRENLDCKSLAEVGDSEHLVARQQEELQMMQEIISSYQIKFVKAVTKEAENRALRDFLTLNMGDIEFSFIPEDADLMREIHFDLEKEYKALTDDIRDLLSSIISKQSKRIGNLEVSNILLRNYESKCSSQKQLLENQKRIVEKLVAEKARNEFMFLVLSLEMKDHMEINGVLKTTYNFINNNKMQSDSRTKILEEKLTMSKAQTPSMPILSKETFLHQLNSIITLPSSSSSSSVFASKLQLTAEDLLEKCRIVFQKNQSLNLNKKLFNNMAEEGAFILNKEITECMKLFPTACLKPSSLKSLAKQADGFVEFGLAQLMLPQSIVVLMADLDDALQKLEKFVGETVRDLEKKKGALKSDRFLAEERNLYINFFTNPELFRRQMARIKSRVSQQQTH